MRLTPLYFTYCRNIDIIGIIKKFYDVSIEMFFSSLVLYSQTISLQIKYFWVVYNCKTSNTHNNIKTLAV